MNIYIGADHRGFKLKEHLKDVLAKRGYEAIDVGADRILPDDDYPDYAAAVARSVAADPAESRGIIICGSGFGVDIVANKFDGVRSGLATVPNQIYQGRHDDDVNVLALPASFVDESTAENIMMVFLTAPFGRDERYRRRIEKIAKLEKNN